MIRRRNAILLAVGLLVPIVPIALGDTPAGAIDQDLVASPTSGPPGTAITVSSASCTGASQDDAFLEASLYVGTAPDQQIAAYGSGPGAATLTVPDWVDPDQPAVIEASCDIWSEDGNTDEYLEYDPIAFDVEPGSGTPVQVASYSRTELLAGQGLTVTGSCGPTMPDAFVLAVVGSGSDETGKGWDISAGYGFSQADGDGAFELPLYLTNAGIGYSVVTEDSTVTDFSVDEEPMDIPAGDYTAFVYCEADDDQESYQFLQPQPIDITGSAPTAGVDLTATAGTRNVTLAGACASGDVVGVFEGTALSSLIDDFEPLKAGGAHEGSWSTRSDRAATTDGPFDGLRAAGGSHRLVEDGDYTEFAATTDASGAWQATETAGFDEGIVTGNALCGDPMADGYVYDPQGAVIEVVEPTPAVLPTVPVTVPYAPPANAVQGNPAYAG